MAITRRHVLHSSVALVVVVLVGLAIGFLVDASQTNRTYDALAAHHVTVAARQVGCAYTGRTTNSNQNSSVLMCRVSYGYKGQSFSNLVPYQKHYAFLVDPQNTTFRMSSVTFAGGPEAIIGDLVFAILCLVGAGLVTTVHLVHQRRRHRRVTAQSR